MTSTTTTSARATAPADVARTPRIALLALAIIAVTLVTAGCWTGASTTPASDPVAPERGADTDAKKKQRERSSSQSLPLTLADPQPGGDPLVHAAPPPPGPPPPPPTPRPTPHPPPPGPPPPPPSGLRVKTLAPRIVTTSPLALVPGVEHRIEGLCVSGSGRLVVPDHAVLTFTGDRPVVIGGGGLTPAKGVSRLHVQIVALDATELFILFDNVQVPIDALVYAPKATVDLGLTGKTGLNLVQGGLMSTAKFNAAWGLPPSFPACPYP